MKKSELKKRLVEALTPDEAAKVEPKYKETYAAMIRGKGPLKLKKYDNPDKVVRGRVVNTIKNESLKIAEKLGKTADVGDYKDDFRKSDAPQFKGKSKKKRDQMATAAFLNKEDLDEEISNVTFQKHADRVEDLLRQLIGATKAVDASQDDTEDDVEELDQSIDYLSAALTDKDPIDIAVDQATFGRLAKPTKEEKTLEEIDAMMEFKKRLSPEALELYADDIEPLKKQGKSDKEIAKMLVPDNPDAILTQFKLVGEDKLKETGQEIAKKNMDDYKRLNELVKAALMKETSTDKYDDNPALKGKQSDLPDGLQKAIIKKAGGKANESFDSLSKKIDKQKGKSKKDADNIAGYIANIKRKGGGKGPTAKQKKRMAEQILKELRGSINEMAGEDLELKSLAKKMIPTLKKLGFEVEYSTDTSMKTLKNAGDKFVALRVQDGMLGVHIPFKAGLDAAKEIQKEIQKSLGNEFEYKLTKSKRGPGLEFYTILIRNK